MNGGRRELEQNYPKVLADCMADPGEAALMRAYELGRRALGGGASVVDVAVAHHRALAAAGADGLRADVRRALEAAQAALAEVLSPFELARRQFGEANAALRRLNERLEEEARRIAHALHDEAGQLIVSAHLAIAGLTADLSPRQQAALDEVRRWLDAIEANLRRLSRELRPAILDDLGLVPGLEYLVEGVAARSGLTATIEGSTDGRLGHVAETVLYRVVQEALTNAVRHANAKRVSIRLRREPRTIFCSIRDDGVGFDPHAPHGAGIGLVGIRERLAGVGGSLSIDSAPGRGAELVASVPLPPEETS
ncbi:MAG TPA: sensor histidine kinase [Haliangiales bacterium]|nr:sensor histidine kinase [Haliangiales bacterium]